MMNLIIGLAAVIAVAAVPGSTLNLVSTPTHDSIILVKATYTCLLLKGRDCCKEVVIKSGGNDTAYRQHYELFTTYHIAQDNESYMSRDGRHVIAVCNRRWMVQKAENRYIFSSLS